jgi:NAD+ synthase
MTDDLLRDRPDWTRDPREAAAAAETFIRETVAASGQTGVVVGLSGGIDSAVSAALAVRALGAGAVHAMCLPYRTSNPDSLADAQAVAAAIGLHPEVLEITGPVDAFLDARPDADAVRRGNVMARVRMLTLFDASQARRALVLGTGNRTEWLLGYTTLHGDEACGLNPVGQLYKTEIRLLARHLDLPEVVLTKAPSADLWQGQSDEQELGFTYADADRLLHHLVDEGLAPRQLEALGFAPELIRRIADRLESQAFKRRQPPVCDLGRPAPEPA